MKRLALTLLTLLLVALTAKLVVLAILRVEGTDMAPALQPGDWLLGWRFGRTPQRGDLVLIDHPRDGRPLLRRIIGLPGDTVSVMGEVPRLGPERARQRPLGTLQLIEAGSKPPRAARPQERLLLSETLDRIEYRVLKDPRRRSRDSGPFQLADSYFVLADDRNHGADSRDFGLVPARALRAVVTHRLSAGPGCLAPQAPRTALASLD